MTRRTLARTVVIATAAVSATASLVGCSLLMDAGSGTERDDESGDVTGTTSDSVFSMTVGACLNKPEGTQISDVELVPCTEPHDYEFYSEHELPAGEFPSDLETQAETRCVADFESFVGIPLKESSLRVTWFLPTQVGWEQQDDRVIQCIVFDPAGEMTGSMQGSNR